MYVKMIPRELAVIAVDDPCIQVDGFFFIWTSMIGCIQGQNKCAGAARGEQWRVMEKQENGDGGIYKCQKKQWLSQRILDVMETINENKNYNGVIIYM